MLTFRDRQEAGKALAKDLAFLKGRKDVIVLAIPRGGVVVGYQVAEELGAPLDIYITRKIGAPYNPELALGAVASDGSVILDEELVQRLGVSPDFVKGEKKRQQAEIARRLDKYRGNRPALDLTGKTVVLVDDGVATGATTLATLRALKKQPIARLILAIPVGPPDVIETLAKEADQVVCLSTPEPFWAVGSFYLVFDQTSDEEVLKLLQSSQRKRAAAGQ
jgi:putative phosphoribosyl transferase